MYKIAFLIHNIANGGGTERVTTLLANALNEKGYEITIISCEYGEDSFFSLNRNVKLKALNGQLEKNGFKRRYTNLKKLRYICKKEKYDFFICVDIALMIYAFFLKTYDDIKIIAWEHFNITVQIGSKLIKLSRYLAVRFADEIIVLTDEDLKNYKAKYRNIKHIRRIYNPVNIEINNNEVRENTVLSVGRLEKQKGFDLLLNSWKIVEEKNPNWILKIIGSGKEYDNLLYYIKKLNLKNVQIKSHSKDIAIEYNKAKIYVCSSRFEGFGLVVIEAQQCGLPVISFDCIGPREIINNGYNGILVKQGDTYAMAQSINKLINNEDFAKELVYNAKQTSNKYNVEKALTEWLLLFKSLKT